MNSSSTFQTGVLACVPVNIDQEVGDELRAIRLEDGLGMILGQRTSDHAIIAKALTFREPHWNVLEAEDTVARFGYAIPPRPEEEHASKKKHCKSCGNELPSYSSMCPNCGTDNSSGGGGGGTEAIVQAVVKAMTEAMANIPTPNITIQMPSEGDVEFVRDPETGAITGKRKLKETPSGE